MLKEPSQEHADSYIVRLGRDGYYRLDLAVYGVAAPLAGQLPDGYRIPPNTSQVTTYRFVVRLDWILQRSHGPLFAVEDYDKWARELFTNIRQKSID
jgi:hypothetical protein